ncbi:MAG: methylated-DNA--[protein]-cysteine S-methyltransferase [Candidatus Bipolaricaulaceae bacterium]
MPWGKVPTVWGVFYACWEGEAILALRFPDQAPNGPFAGAPLLEVLAAELSAYFQGLSAEFSVPARLDGPPFCQRVWEEIRRIPYGETLTYRELAERVGHPKAARAVGRALAKNPVPIIVPCHRVVAKQGLGGFGPGLTWKRRLLDLEAAHKVKFAPR